MIKGVDRKISKGEGIRATKKKQKDRKIAKKHRKIALLSLYLLYCTMYENPKSKGVGHGLPVPRYWRP